MLSSRPVRIEKARTLLRPGIPRSGGTWADLGCGDGIFTVALHTLIQPGGIIYAVDKNPRVLESLVRTFAKLYPDAAIRPLLADFTSHLLLRALDGIVMANSLHFVKRKTPVLASLVGLLKPGGRLIVIEYNTNRGNLAVPYPVDEVGFIELAHAAGLHEPRILSRIPSSFLGELYGGIGIARAQRRHRV